MSLETTARYIILVGVVLIIIGALVYGFGKLNFPLGRLPGDIRIESANGSFYFPLTSSIIISIILSVLLNLISRFWRK
jgi:hypothetical protein